MTNETALISKVPEHIVAPNYAIILERLVRDVSIPMERLQEAQAFIERQQMQERAVLFMGALAQAQQEMEPIARDMKNDATRSKYASLAAVDRAIRPHYTKHGLAPTFNTRPSIRGELWVSVICELLHTSGYYKEYSIDMLADGAGAKGAPVMTRTHAIGSAVTYGKRQLLKMIFNLAEAGEDDDGNAAGASEVLTESELEVIKAALDDADCDADDMTRFCKAMKVESLIGLRRSQVAHGMQLIDKMKEYKRKAKAEQKRKADAATNT